MNPIITKQGLYLSGKFTGRKGTWEIISTESVTDEVLDCLDTFINRKTGRYQTVIRSQVYLFAESGGIFLT